MSTIIFKKDFPCVFFGKNKSTISDQLQHEDKIGLMIASGAETVKLEAVWSFLC